MKSSRQRPRVVGRLLAAVSIGGLVTAGGFVTMAMEQESPPADPAVPAFHVTLTLQDSAAKSPTGRVVLEVVPLEPGDPDEAVRLQAVVVGPLPGKGGDDVFALSVGLTYSDEHLEYLPGGLHKGDLLELDGRTSLITGGVTPGDPERVTIGASRLGAVPGVTVPAGRRVLFSLAFRVLKPGDAVLAWEEARFIDSNIKPVEGARFIDATLHLKLTEN